MKNPWEWTEEDLLDLVKNQVQESLTLDYKASKALERTEKAKDEITKDVSALANSAGGTLVYGIPENKQTRLAEKVDEGVDPAVLTREWLDQVINSNIQRRIDGVRINQIPLTTVSPGRVAYVIHVPQSVRAPHQARDKLFYKRFEYHSKPMEEYEIRDVARRQEEPDLRVRFQMDWSQHGAAEPNVTRWQVVLVNNSPVPCHEAVVDLQIDSSFKLRNRGPLNANYHTMINGEKGTIPLSEISIKVPEMLETIQSDMYLKAEKAFREHRLQITSWDDVLPALDNKNVVLIPFCLGIKCEERIKKLTAREDDQPDVPESKKLPTMGMKSLCIPFEQPEGIVEGETECLNPECQSKAQKWVMFGRSY